MQKYHSLLMAVIVFTFLSLQGAAQNSLNKFSAKQIDSLLTHNWLMTMVDWNGDKKLALEKSYMNFRSDKTVTIGDDRDKMTYIWSYNEERNMIFCKNKIDPDDNPYFNIVTISSTELVLSFTGEGYPVVTYLKRVK